MDESAGAILGVFVVIWLWFGLLALGGTFAVCLFSPNITVSQGIANVLWFFIKWGLVIGTAIVIFV